MTRPTEAGGRDKDMYEEEMEVEEEMSADLEEEEMEMDVDMDPEPEPDAPAEDNTEIAQKLAAGIADLLSQVLGVEVESEMDGDEEPPDGRARNER